MTTSLADHLRSLPDESLAALLQLRPDLVVPVPADIVRARHPGPVPGLGGPRPGRAGPVHPPDPRRRPAHPGPGRRHHLGRPDPGHGHRRAAPARTDRRPRRRGPAPRPLPAVRPRPRPAAWWAASTRSPRTRPGWADRRRSWTRARRRSARTRRSCGGRCWPRRPSARAILDRLAAGPPVGSVPPARCRPRPPAPRTNSRRTRSTAARRPAPRCAGWSTTGCWCGSPAARAAHRHGRAAPRGRAAAAPRHRAARPAAHQPAAGGQPSPASRRPSTPPAPGRPWRWYATPRRCWRQLAAEPAPVLRSGGLGVRDLRRLARATGLDEPTTALLLEVAYAAGLTGEVELPGSATARYGGRPAGAAHRRVRAVAGGIAGPALGAAGPRLADHDPAGRAWSASATTGTGRSRCSPPRRSAPARRPPDGRCSACSPSWNRRPRPPPTRCRRCSTGGRPDAAGAGRRRIGRCWPRRPRWA